MVHSSIGKTANRLRWAVWIFWACVIVAYVAGRFGFSWQGAVEVQAHSSAAESGSPMIVADISIIILSVALYHLGKMLGAIGEGDLFSVRVVKSFRSFAFWLLLLAIAWVVAPIAAALWAGPDESHRLAFKLQLRDILTIGIALILFLVARLLERARTIDEERREIV